MSTKGIGPRSQLLWTLALGTSVLVACKQLPPESDWPERMVAVGDISHSTPIFTPLTSYETDSNRRLDLSKLRGEQTLAEGVQQANITIDEATATFQEISGALSVAGPQLSQATTLTQSRASEASQSESRRRSRERTLRTDAGDPGSATIADEQESVASRSGSAGDVLESTATTSLSTPAIPETPDQIGASPAIQGELAKLLARAQREHVLTQDEVATVVASLKMYMVGLEDFFNASSIYEAAMSGESKWYPYRMHFVVSTEPGWYTQFDDYDAVLELAVGAPNKVRIVNAVPPQTAQTIDQFTAEYKSLSSSLSGGGSAQRVAASAAVRRLKDAAERLQGVRSNTTFSASFPGPDGNRVRLRFHPNQVPDGKSRTDLQSTSRIVTATVLIHETVFDTCNQKKENADVLDCITEIGTASSSWFEDQSKDRLRPHPVICLARDEARQVPENTRSRCPETQGATVFVPRWRRDDAFGELEVVKANAVFWDLAEAKPAGKDAKAEWLPTVDKQLEGVLELELQMPTNFVDYNITLTAPGVCFRDPNSTAENPTCMDNVVWASPGSKTWPLAIDTTKIHGAASIQGFLHIESATNKLTHATKGSDWRSITAEIPIRRVSPNGPKAPPSSQPGTNKPTVTITSGDLTLDAIPLADIPLDVLKALVGDRATLTVLAGPRNDKPSKPTPSKPAK